MLTKIVLIPKGMPSSEGIRLLLLFLFDLFHHNSFAAVVFNLLLQGDCFRFIVNPPGEEVIAEDVDCGRFNEFDDPHC